MFLGQIAAGTSIDVLNVMWQKEFLDVQNYAKLSLLNKDHQAIVQKTRAYPIMIDTIIQEAYSKYKEQKTKYDAHQKEIKQLRVETARKPSFFEEVVLGTLPFLYFLPLVQEFSDINKKKKELWKLENLSHSIKLTFDHSFWNFHDKRNDLRVMQLFNGRQEYKKLPKLGDPSPHFQESFKWFQEHILPSLRKSLVFLIPEAEKNQQLSSLLKIDYHLFLTTLFFGAIYQVNPEFVEGIFKEKITELAQVITPLFNHCSTHFSEIIETFTEAFVAFDEKENNKMMNNLLLLFLTKIVKNPVTVIKPKYVKMLKMHNMYSKEDRTYAKCFVVRIKDAYTGQYSLKCYRKQDHKDYYSQQNEWWEEVCTIPMNIEEFTKQEILEKIGSNFKGAKLFTKNDTHYKQLRELIIDKKSIDAIGRPFTVE